MVNVLDCRSTRQPKQTHPRLRAWNFGSVSIDCFALIVCPDGWEVDPADPHWKHHFQQREPGAIEEFPDDAVGF